MYKHKANKSHRHVLISVFIDGNRYMYSVWYIGTIPTSWILSIFWTNNIYLLFIHFLYTHCGVHSVDIIMSIGFYWWILFLFFYLNITHFLYKKKTIEMTSVFEHSFFSNVRFIFSYSLFWMVASSESFFCMCLKFDGDFGNFPRFHYWNGIWCQLNDFFLNGPMAKWPAQMIISWKWDFD